MVYVVVMRMEGDALKPLSGEQLRALRRRLGLSQAELGKRLHFSQQTISSWECGRRRIVPATYSSLLDTLQTARRQQEAILAAVVNE